MSSETCASSTVFRRLGENMQDQFKLPTVGDLNETLPDGWKLWRMSMDRIGLWTVEVHSSRFGFVSVSSGTLDAAIAGAVDDANAKEKLWQSAGGGL